MSVERERETQRIGFRMLLQQIDSYNGSFHSAVFSLRNPLRNFFSRFVSSFLAFLPFAFVFYYTAGVVLLLLLLLRGPVRPSEKSPAARNAASASPLLRTLSNDRISAIARRRLLF